MSNIKNITLAFPCHEKLACNAVGEFYCNACARTIVDFRCQSAEALEIAMRQSSKPICGIFKRSQLSEQFVRYAAATAIVASAMAGTMCTPDPSLAEASNNAAVEAPEEDIPILGFVAETMATPVGGFEKFLTSIQHSLRAPRGVCVTGAVYVQFTVDSSGKTKDFKVVKGLHPEVDREAVRAIESLNYAFEPARQSGVIVESRLVMPIRFLLTEH